ncbi:hypothetical protein [Flavobacterium sp. LC2016-12]|uniref:hypothetical protein n=1 Tax=Flavobacterium sp. LC2016-12 TaxID=2783794 RepID=UPI00188A46EF|nr:hypothetical protein [Flavobacterium sp. LC2016-12]MBF4465659.1 hypothetical protein [Flavobacterium sp. LC2016-12]
MISKIKKIISENANRQHEQIRLSKELEWAHVYHDSIRGKKWLEELPLNVGRWAGNYSFFYVLNRILSDYKPKTILDLGLGESSKFISSFLDNYLLDSTHTIVEQDKNWIKEFQNRFSLVNRSNVIFCPIKEIEIKGQKSNSYDGFSEKVKGQFDLYIVDGPFGSPKYSRYDIIAKIEEFDSDQEFIILFDDTNRRGEKDTVEDILTVLRDKKIEIFTKNYIGHKTNTVIATKKYQFATSL